MTLTQSLEHLLKNAITSFQTMVPAPITVEPTIALSPEMNLPFRSVFIGLTGDISGSLIIQGEERTFSNLARSMFGMEIEGAMLQSFTCELGNMIAGNFATEATNVQVSLDITPPCIYEEAFFTSMGTVVSLPLKFQDNGYLHISISMN
ncbi:chemotaxis protein CheX [Bacillus songklensis]|uniref:Chemotaxis protein CheX n=1 Tax=Bacillus songklensis TaxID=1069116 RepID=A0ABV8B2A3_9BACI